MATRQPAAEPYESRDLALGAALRSWVASNAIPGELQLDGPLEAKGMDPTWVLRLRAPDLEADVLLFYGPMVDVSAFRPKHLDDRALVGGEDDVTPERLIEMLNDLAQTAGGGVLASWLRPSP